MKKWRARCGEDQNVAATEHRFLFTPANGTVYAPWIAWGPYDWANGMIPRSDGLVWSCQDLDMDGPSNPAGRIKISTELLNFLKTDDTASIWFLAPGAK